MEESPKPSAKNKTGKFVSTHGRRKEATARVRLYKGAGQNLINGKPLEKYFPQTTALAQIKRIFEITKTESKYYATIIVSGSGKNAQLEAVIHGLARALAKSDGQLRPIIKRAKLLSRDARVKERRKYGLAQKARKGKQSPKR